MLILLGPLSSASPTGQGSFFSVLFIIVGGWGLIRSWVDYRKHRETQAPLFNLLGITALATLFLALGIWGLVR